MYDYRKLKGRIIEKYDSYKNFADAMGYAIDNLVSRKMTNQNTRWTVDDIPKVCKLLDIPIEDIGLYFFKERE